jgi:hypothetical protein
VIDLGAHLFWGFFRSYGGREIMFSKEKKRNFRGYSKEKSAMLPN